MTRNKDELRDRQWHNVPDLTNAPDDLLLAPKEVAALSGYCEESWRLWRRQGRGPAWLIIEGRPRMRFGDYREWLAAQERG